MKQGCHTQQEIGFYNDRIRRFDNNRPQGQRAEFIVKQAHFAWCFLCGLYALIRLISSVN